MFWSKLSLFGHDYSALKFCVQIGALNIGRSNILNFFFGGSDIKKKN
jgi:hypothetical protein